MRARAEWRSRSDDPRTFAGWLLRDADSPIRYVARYLSAALKIAALIALWEKAWFPAFILFSLSSIPDALVRPFWIGRRSLNARVNPLLTLPSPTTPFPCQIEILRGSLLLGKDQGVVTFVDGWLHYEGLLTSFTLSRNAVSAFEGHRLVLAEGGAVRFYPEDGLVAGGETETELKKRFESKLKRWRRSDAPDGESILPPLRIHAAGVARAWNTFVVSAIFLSFAALFAYFVFGGSDRGLLVCSPFLFGFLNSLRNLSRASSIAANPEKRPLPLRRKRGLGEGDPMLGVPELPPNP